MPLQQSMLLPTATMVLYVQRGAVSHPILPLAAMLRPRIPRGELVYNKDFARGAEAHVWLPLNRKW